MIKCRHPRDLHKKLVVCLCNLPVDNSFYIWYYIDVPKGNTPRTARKETLEISKEISKKGLTNQTDCGIIKMFQRERKNLKEPTALVSEKEVYYGYREENDCG